MDEQETAAAHWAKYEREQAQHERTRGRPSLRF